MFYVFVMVNNYYSVNILPKVTNILKKQDVNYNFLKQGTFNPQVQFFYTTNL
ncbi:conserved hypothetical protein [Capnocytophaga canimorsus]|uniref:Uncharacterized protein n=1 Tax=Capnocytophaga canimorsus TaxID=28188 RepID=A0A0B7H447_9FLAO|nr:conserved hypothetical protein [Capnocytophaga canimorsus]